MGQWQQGEVQAVLAHKLLGVPAGGGESSYNIQIQNIYVVVNA